jgi:OmpA-OmpF porin, OOP family
LKSITKSLSLTGAAMLFFVAPYAIGQAPPPNGPLGGPEAYVIDARGQIVKSPQGMCWRTQWWTPATAGCECDKDILPAARCAPPAPAPVSQPPRPAPPPPPPPMKPKACNFTTRLTGDATFEFDKYALRPAARAQLDRDVIGRLSSCASITGVSVNGHTDRIGSATYNQKLSERRAEAVKAYLVSKGMDASKIDTYGYGKTQPIKSCPDQKDFKALIACLAPNRRAEVEVRGPGK